jgi:Cof subfamily protein (haloacid dehalogenase superfamily)
MSIRAVLMDMDGTLLGKSQVAVSIRNMTAVQKAIDKGIHVIPCTGRVYNMLPPQLLTQRGLRYFITSHGARVYDKISNKSVFENLIPTNQSVALLKMLEKKGLYNEIAVNGTIYFEKDVVDHMDMSVVPEHHLWYIRDNCFTAVDNISDYFLKNNLSIEKMNIYGIPQTMQHEIYDAVTATGFIGHTRPGAGPNLEFLHSTLNILDAVNVVLDKLGVSYEETLAIGDSSSDLEIIKACGIGIAMDNAPNAIKAAADHISGSNTEDGLAKAFEKFVL